jgi:hypothetical protein
MLCEGNLNGEVSQVRTADLSADERGQRIMRRRFALRVLPLRVGTIFWYLAIIGVHSTPYKKEAAFGRGLVTPGPGAGLRSRPSTDRCRSGRHRADSLP